MFFLSLQVGYATSHMTITTQTSQLVAGIEVLCMLRLSQLDSLNVWELVTLLDLYGAKCTKEHFHNIVGRILLDSQDVGWKFAVIILRALGNIPTRHEKLEELCLSRILNYMASLSDMDLLTVVNACYKMELYDHELLNAMSDEIVSRHFSIKDRLTILKSFRKVDFLSKSLVSGLICELSELDGDHLDLDTCDITDSLHIMAESSHQLSNINNSMWLSQCQQWIESKKNENFSIGN